MEQGELRRLESLRKTQQIRRGEQIAVDDAAPSAYLRGQRKFYTGVWVRVTQQRKCQPLVLTCISAKQLQQHPPGPGRTGIQDSF